MNKIILSMILMFAFVSSYCNAYEIFCYKTIVAKKTELNRAMKYLKDNGFMEKSIVQYDEEIDAFLLSYASKITID
jgi:hypothetical protein